MLPLALAKRPRLLNILHALRCAPAHTQTYPEELETLRRHASGKKTAVEIGSYMGASAAVISRALAPEGKLWCVDPWPRRGSTENPICQVFLREIRRRGDPAKIEILRGFSRDMAPRLPERCDFFFIDGDHSFPGVETDWSIALERLAVSGVVCLHDTAVPEREPKRWHESMRFYAERIATDSRFELLERTQSLNVLRRVA